MARVVKVQGAITIGLTAAVLSLPSAHASGALGGAAPLAADQLSASGAVVNPHGNEPALQLSEPISRVPLELHRRAARHFEALRQTSDSNWFEARLADHATPMLRPGVEGVAYWEIPVLGSKGDPLGYLLLSTGEHDFPVVGAARGGDSASATLAELAAQRGQRVARIWAPAPFTFVAENARGEEVARLGELPSKLEGVDKRALSLPESARRGFSALEPGSRPVAERPAALANLVTVPFNSWQDYRAAMASGDSLQQAITEKNAAPFWQTERRVGQTAHELSLDAAERIQVLARGEATYRLSGAGKEHVALERVEGPGGEAWLRVRALSAPSAEVAQVDVELEYGSGERERLGFAIAPRKLALPVPVLGQAFPATCRQVAIRTWERGNYVRAHERKGAVDARADKVGVWETFDFEQHSDGTVSFRAGRANRYLSADGGGGRGLALIGVTAHNWERFRLVPQAGGTHALKAHNGKFVMAKAGGGDIISVNSATASTWERFQIACNPPAPPSYFADNRDEAGAFANQRKYRQLAGREAPNTSQCATGCGSTAWAMLVGYTDYMSTQGVARHRGFNRAYLRGGGRGRHAADAVAPEFNDPGVVRMTLEIRALMNDWGASGCGPTGQRFTLPHIMAQANQYFWGRIPARVIADYDGLMVSTQAGVNKVLHTLRTRRHPVAVGMHEHYPVAFGIRSVTPRRWDPAKKTWATAGSTEWMVDANWGWGEKFSRSVPLYSWFHGTIETTPYSRVDAVANDCRLRGQSGGPSGRVDRDYNCRTHLKNSERHVGFEVAVKLLDRDVLPGLRSRNQKACLLKTTDIQCAPCNTTDRLIVRMDVRSKSAACPADTVNELR